jgi:hypothetical protein
MEGLFAYEFKESIIEFGKANKISNILKSSLSKNGSFGIYDSKDLPASSGNVC